MKLAALLLALTPFAALAQKPAPLLPAADPTIQKLMDVGLTHFRVI